MKEFIQNLEWYTLITGALTIISAISTFILDRASEKDGRKKFLGVFRKDLKRYAAYLTLLFSILTLLLEDRHKVDEKLNGIVEKQKEENKQKGRFDTTLIEIGKTLKKQDSTLRFQDSTLRTQSITLHLQDSTIKRANEILKNQIQTLKTQTATLNQNNLIIKSQNEQFATLNKVLLNVDEINGAMIEISYKQDIDSSNFNSYNNFIKNLGYFDKIFTDKENFEKNISKMRNDGLQVAISGDKKIYGEENIDVQGKLLKIARCEPAEFRFEMYLLDNTPKMRSIVDKVINSVSNSKWNHSEPNEVNGYDVKPLSSIPYKVKLTFDMQCDKNYFFYSASSNGISSIILKYFLKASIDDSKAPITFDDLENQLVLIRIQPSQLGFRIMDNLSTFTKAHKSLEIKNISFLRERWGGSSEYDTWKEQYYLLEFGKLKYASQ